MDRTTNIVLLELKLKIHIYRTH